VLEVKCSGPEFVYTVQYIVVFVTLRNIPGGRSLYSFDPFALSERGLLSIPKCPVKSYKFFGRARETVTLGITRSRTSSTLKETIGVPQSMLSWSARGKLFSCRHNASLPMSDKQ
jgi:hypothetical protein